ncbi:myosin light chain kinase, smooth muscle isoform X1 [Denticeps clupeoides]|nr:myosin light chain kinase, smooth muscle-like isoform X1 [Denticeps clupeoides]XP_028846561.1 myosin light chain kinase, smooth muscle-like isoform X1 [Denticeps clupeoides]
MEDVQIVTATRISKTSLTLGQGSLSNEPPVFTLPPRNTRVSPGGTARLDGKVRGSPETQVCWYRNGKVLVAGGRFSMEQSSHGLFGLAVQDVQEEDAGRYTCETRNEAGGRQVTVEIVVEGNGGKKYNLPSSGRAKGDHFAIPAVENRTSIWGESPPKFVNKPSRLYLRVGQSGKFSAKITGRPQPQVVWLKGAEELPGSGRFRTFTSSGIHFLEIREACMEDAGMYTCSVTNSAGKATATAELNVQGSDAENGMNNRVSPDVPLGPTKDESTAGKPTSNGLPNNQTLTSTPSDHDEAHNALTIKPDSKDSKRSWGWRTRGTSPNPPPSEAKNEDLRRTESSSGVQQQSRAETDAHIRGPQRPAADTVETSRLGPTSRASSRPEASREVLRSTRESRVELLTSAPRFESSPQSQEAVEGTKVIFRCQVSGSPEPLLSWVKDGIPIRSRAGLTIQQDSSQHLLSLERVQRDDGGQYSCTAINSRGRASCTWTLSVKNIRPAGKPPLFRSVIKGCTVTEEQDFTLQCSVEGRPTPTVTWMLDDKPCLHSLAEFERGQAQLTVRRAVASDAGSYSCIAENEHGRAECSARVVIKEKTSVRRAKAANEDDLKRPSAPLFLRGLKDLKVMDGSQVTMTVEVMANPPPEVVWLHNGKEIQESEDFHFEREGNQCKMLIQEVFPEDTGKYTCEAWNEVGEARTEASLTVQEPQDGVQPWFITKPKSIVASPGQHVLLSCAIAGDPFPEFTWAKDGQEVSAGADFEIFQKEDVISLLIKRAKAHHAGDYEISLKNKVGDCSSAATLTVEEGSSDTPMREGGGLVGGVDGTARGRGGSSVLGRSISPIPQREPEPEEASGTRGLFKRRVETKEHREDQIRQQEPQQVDFRAVLGRKVTPKSVSEEDLKEITAEQMDFRGSLQRQVKPKTLTEDQRKASSPQQVDFRAMLGKKGGPATKPKQTSLEKNGECPAVKKEKENAPNCVDGGIIGGKAPGFTQKLRDVTVVDGQRLRLECQVSAEPPGTVTWTLDGKVIKASKFILLSYEGGLCSLTIDKALPEDEGQYTCRVENAAGKAECVCVVLVDDPSDTNSTPADKRAKKPSTPTTENEAKIKKPPPKTPPKQAHPPQIQQFPDDMKILAGKPVELLCKFVGAQPVTCTWFKFRKPIQTNKTDLFIESTDTTSKLTIPCSHQDHCGCYTVEVKNNHGMRQAALNLTIVDKPDPPARVPAASDIRRSSLTLSWYGPTYDGGSAVQSYNLEIWDSVGQEWKLLVSCNSTSYCVQDLLADRQYKFRVRAVNIYGIGEPSAESEAVTVGVEEEEQEEEAEISDEDCEKEPEYRNVVIRTDVKVKDLYDVDERLGSGKFGTVFKLVEKSTKKVWAGKFIKAYSAKEKDNVREEISIMNDLHHPKLVQCVDAFEGKSDIVMVMELISGGELFERIIDEDFELTEREVIKYMRQIVNGVNFIHKQGIVHLDLKPENIMCVNKTGSRIKLIDFGLARRLENAGTLKVLFGTPEFVAPEVINYEAISYPTDMWSIGVICYILVSGLSPFMGDNDSETLSNVTSATWDFEDEAFDEISDEAKNFISHLLKKDMKARLTCDQCFEHTWLKQDTKNMEAKKLSKERMKKYILRRKWQKTGHAVRAIGRLSTMAMLAGVHAKSPTEVENQPQDAPEAEEKTPVKPSFSAVIRDMEVVEGSAARFDCNIEGFPDPEVVWYKDDQPIKETRHFQIDYDVDGNCSLVISEVSGDDDAKYTCKAMNSLGEATCTAELIVEVMGEEEEEEEEEE